jgi:hypothetical protein
MSCWWPARAMRPARSSATSRAVFRSRDRRWLSSAGARHDRAAVDHRGSDRGHRGRLDGEVTQADRRGVDRQPQHRCRRHLRGHRGGAPRRARVCGRGAQERAPRWPSCRGPTRRCATAARCSWSTSRWRRSSAWRAAARAALGRAHRRGDRQRRQDHQQGGPAPGAVDERTDPCLGGVLQQPVGRAAVAGAAAARRGLCGVRDRHEPGRRDHAADPAGAPPCRHRHHHRGEPSRLFRLAGGHRRCQGRDLSPASSPAGRR